MPTRFLPLSLQLYPSSIPETATAVGFASGPLISEICPAAVGPSIYKSRYSAQLDVNQRCMATTSGAFYSALSPLACEAVPSTDQASML